MKYNKLFETLHSEAISESTKTDIVSKLLDKVVLSNVDLLEETLYESESNISNYVKVLSTLVNSNMSNESLMEMIDLIFANKTQEVVDKVNEAFQEDVVKGILVHQLLLEEEEIEEAAAPIGLVGLRKEVAKRTQGQASSAATPEPKKPAIKTNMMVGKGGELQGGQEGSFYRLTNTDAIKRSAERARARKQAEANRPVAKNLPAVITKPTETFKPETKKPETKKPETKNPETLKPETKKPVEAKVASATKKRSNKVATTNTASNIRKGIGGGFNYSDEITTKLNQVKGNPGATEAVKHSKKAEAEVEAKKDGEQLKLNLNGDSKETKPSSDAEVDVPNIDANVTAEVNKQNEEGGSGSGNAPSSKAKVTKTAKIPKTTKPAKPAKPAKTAARRGRPPKNGKS